MEQRERELPARRVGWNRGSHSWIPVLKAIPTAVWPAAPPEMQAAAVPMRIPPPTIKTRGQRVAATAARVVQAEMVGIVIKAWAAWVVQRFLQAGAALLWAEGAVPARATILQATIVPAAARRAGGMWLFLWEVLVAPRTS